MAKSFSIYFFTLLVLFTSDFHPASFAAQPLIAAVEIDRLEQSTLYFKAVEGLPVPPPLKTDLKEAKPLGAIYSTKHTFPYFVLAGKNDQSSETQVFVLRPRAKASDPETITHFVYPGKILDPKTRAVLLESRAFVGQCIYNNPNSLYVVYQRERVDRRHKLQASVFLAEYGEDHLSERLLERGFPRISDTLKQVRAKVCREIEGQNRLMLRKPLDLTPRRGMDDSDDDDDDDEKPVTPAQPAT